MKRNIYSFFLLVTILVTTPFLIRFLLINQKIKILNSIYFNYPGIITRKKSCPTFNTLLNKTLDSSFSVSIINEKGDLIGIKVVKGKADPSSDYEVDGISGATITSKGLESFLVEDLKKYESFFKNIREG